jgi:histidinol-phosphate/aromatic aminotransferase/cobyric acid decarboxylase-like protein
VAIPALQEITKPYQQSNLILCRVLEDAAELGSLLDYGVFIRYFNKPLAGIIRISVGRPHDTDKLMKALQSL